MATTTSPENSGEADVDDQAAELTLLQAELAHARLVIKMSRDSLEQNHIVATRNRLNRYLRDHP